MSADLKAPNNGQQPHPLLEETPPSDHLPQPSLRVSYPYNHNLENFQLLPTMFMNPSFPDSLLDHELESQFSNLNISANPSYQHQHQHQQYSYLNNMHDVMNNGGLVGSPLGNTPPFVFDDYSRFLNSNEDVVDACMQQPQGFYNGSENLMGLPRLSNFAASSSMNSRSVIPRSFNANGVQNPYEYFDVVPSAAGGARNGCNPSQYNVYSNCYNGRSGINNGGNPNRYLSSLANDRVQPRPQRVLSFSSLESLRGSIYVAAKDQHGCRFLQKKVEERKPEDIEMIYLEVRPHVRELMVDQCGNFLMQKLFEVCSSQHMDKLLVLLISNRHQFLTICVDSHGTRAVQKLIEYLSSEEQRAWLLSQLQHITLDLCKNTNGHHVIRHCLKFFNARENKQILDVVVLHCIEIATDRSGCCVLQQCVEHAQGKHRDRLVNEITKNVVLLSENRYGNYVVQYLLGLGDWRITNDVLAHLKNNYVPLSLNKFGSNVVEKCLKEADDVQVDIIILEIITHCDFLMILQDSYGNYVAQSALARAQGLVRDQMIRGIQRHYPSLHSHPHGKRVLAKAKENINKQRST